MKKKLMKIFGILVLLLVTIIVIFSCYMKKQYTKIPFEELYFYMFNGVTNSDYNVFVRAIIDCLPYIALLFFVLYIIFYDISFGKIKSKFYPFKSIVKHREILLSFLLLLSIYFGLYNLNYFKYIENTNTTSNFIELNYSNPKNTDIEFSTKKNLILIVAESLETSFFTKEQGGYWNYDVTPELYDLLNDDDSITFYNNNKAQGMKMITGASYTTASVFANTSGLPFKVPIDGNSYHSKNFMNGAYTLGDLLYDNGYYNELISSARTSFGGINEYFAKHGKYTIVDADNVKDYKLKMKDENLGSWGFNDDYLFSVAKSRLSDISSMDKPFNLTLISIDTHATDGFIGNYSVSKYKTQYENVYATESKLIYNFVSWVKEQDFYKDTVIVIIGDHTSMQNDYFKSRNITDRYVYNCIINSNVSTSNNSKREFSALDTFPTIVSAIGGSIEYDKLGLGINLFSDKKTLIERYGFDYVDSQLTKKSDFYDKKIIDDEYIEDKTKETNKYITKYYEYSK